LSRRPSGARQEFRQADRLDPPLDHDHLLDEGVVGDDVEAERLGSLGDRTGDMAKRDQPEGQAAQPRNLQQRRPALRPAAFAHHAVLLDKPAVRGEHQPHRVVGDFLDEGVGAVGDRDALGGRGVDIDRVDPDTAEGDDFAALQPVDHLPGDRTALGIKRIGILGGGDEFILRAGRNFVDFGVDWG